MFVPVTPPPAPNAGNASRPTPSERRVAVRVTRDAQRQIRSGHPWVFDASITSVGHDGAVGDLAVIFDDDRRFLAVGLFDPTSPIRVRILHEGAPLAIDADFWFSRVGRALARRQPLLDDVGTTAYRCIHGENDGLPGLVLDRYADVAVLKLDTAAWIPHLGELVPAVMAELEPSCLLLRYSRSARTTGEAFGLAEGTALAGAVPDGPVTFRENGLWFAADVVHGQKTGHFLDQRDNRARVGERARGCRVLDVFSCTGGFTVNAAAGGATAVHSVDASPHAIAAVAANLERNADRPAVRRTEPRATVGDAFAVMAELIDLGRRFDLVVVDPPSFASKQADVGRALSAYRRLTGLALDLVARGGTLVQSSCSSRVGADEFFAAIHDTARASGRRLTEIERTGHGLDHPVGFAHGAYLKTLFARIG